MTTFYVKVIPDQDELHIDSSGTYPTIHLTQNAEHNRANTELTAYLSDLLGTAVHIVSGHNSRRKKLSADCDKATVDETLADEAP